MCVVSIPFGRRVWCIRWPNLSFYCVFRSVTMSSSYWFSVLRWMMSGLSLPIVSFFFLHSFLSILEKGNICPLFFWFFNFIPYIFFIVYFHPWPFYIFFMFLIFSLNYNLSYIIFFNLGWGFSVSSFDVGFVGDWVSWFLHL